MPLCFFACDDTSVLYCNDDCLKFFREQAPGTESPAAAQRLQAAFRDTRYFPSDHTPAACLLFPGPTLPPGFPRVMTGCL